jgi:hypothetical protein
MGPYLGSYIGEAGTSPQKWETGDATVCGIAPSLLGAIARLRPITKGLRPNRTPLRAVRGVHEAERRNARCNPASLYKLARTPWRCDIAAATLGCRPKGSRSPPRLQTPAALLIRMSRASSKNQHRRKTRFNLASPLQQTRNCKPLLARTVCGPIGANAAAFSTLSWFRGHAPRIGFSTTSIQDYVPESFKKA